jgi:NitT/TauT family transport system ATP-binding protein
VNTGEPILETSELAFGYPTDSSGAPTMLFSDVTLRVTPNTGIAIMGANGCGKSSFAKVLSGYLTACSGSLRWHEDVGRACDVVYADQAAINSVFPWQTVRNNVEWPLATLGWAAAERSKRATALLEALKLRHLESSYPRRLSGGELQRLALARVLSWKPRVLILDEALSALDRNTWEVVVEALLHSRAEEGLTLVFITHHLADVMSLADRCLVFNPRGGPPLADVAIELPYPRLGTCSEVQREQAALGERVREGLLQ